MGRLRSHTSAKDARGRVPRPPCARPVPPVSLSAPLQASVRADPAFASAFRVPRTLAFSRAGVRRMIERYLPLIPTIGAGIALRPSSILGAGLGLYATKPYARGETVTFYDGE